MKYLAISLLFIIFVWISGCDSEVRRAPSKPASSGTTLELLVIADNPIWEGQTGNAIKAHFGQEQPGLGQAEPLFDVRQLPHQQFNKLFQKHRNILIVQKKENVKPKANYRRNVWSQPQIVVLLQATTEEQIVELIDKEKEKMQELFHNAERQRIINAYTRLNQNNLSNQIKERMNLSILVPEGFYIATLKDDFVWIRRETAKLSQGIMVYSDPYVSQNQFSPDNILERRDSVTRKRIPGPRHGSFMATEPLFRPFTRTLRFNESFATEVRGLWRTDSYHDDGPIMGGPFLNITTYDEENQRLIGMDGFVYYPNRDKRDYLMQLEAIIHSIEFIAPESDQATESQEKADTTPVLPPA